MLFPMAIRGFKSSASGDSAWVDCEAMDHNLISAVAALAGAAIVAAVSFLRSWLVHQGEVRAQWLAQEGLRRQDLYKEFIEEASNCYLHALQHHEPDISLLVVLYAKMSRMRVLASLEYLQPRKPH